MEVKVGQIWIDNDKRIKPLRRLRVELIHNGRAKCWSYYNTESLGRYVWIQLDRFKPNASGYALQSDVPPETIVS